MVQCSGCGEKIKWIKIKKSEKYNPVNLPLLKYPYEGNPIVVTESGRVAKLSEVGEGYISHFSTCEKSNSFRLKKRGSRYE